LLQTKNSSKLAFFFGSQIIPTKYKGACLAVSIVSPQLKGKKWWTLVCKNTCEGLSSQQFQIGLGLLYCGKDKKL
jgi:hypothetical protein